ncbi:MAG: hypothetical protein WAK90_18790 [Pseudolabrys sp.]
MIEAHSLKCTPVWFRYLKDEGLIPKRTKMPALNTATVFELQPELPKP